MILINQMYTFANLMHAFLVFIELQLDNAVIKRRSIRMMRLSFHLLGSNVTHYNIIQLTIKLQYPKDRLLFTHHFVRIIQRQNYLNKLIILINKMISVIIKQNKSMSNQHARRYVKEVNGNQNYLNFIKKNQMSIHQQLYSRSRNTHLIEKKSNMTSSLIQNDEHNYSPSIGSNKVINHVSLSKFHIGENSNHNQISLIHNMAFEKAKEGPEFISNTYNTIANINSEDSSIYVKTRTSHAKHQAAKQLLLNFHKNRTIQSKRSGIRQTFDTSKPNQDMNTTNNFKFPIIVKKHVVSFTNQVADQPSLQFFQDQIRESLKKMQKCSQKQAEIISSSQKKEKISVDQTLKIRQELYGLLPVFRTPVMTLQKRKSKNLHSKKSHSHLVKIQPSSKDMIEEYLQQNISMKIIYPPKDKKNQPNQTNSPNNINSIQSPFLENKQEFDLIENLNPNDQNIKQVQLQTIQSSKQNERVRSKKAGSVIQMKHDGDLTVYDLKIRSYRQFLFMVNLAHRIFDPLVLKESNTFKAQHRYKFYLGKGNNYLLVKSLLKRRFWWAPEEDPKKANFVWTQLKLNYFYQLEKKSEISKQHYKLDEDFSHSSTLKKKNIHKNQSNNQSKPKTCIYKAPLPPNDKKIFTIADKKYYDQFLEKAENYEKSLKYSNRLKYFDENFFKIRNIDDISSQKVHNHLQYNYFIGNKKALFYNMKQYYDLQKKNVFEVIPLTFHIKNGVNDPQYLLFSQQFKRLAKEKHSGKGAIKNVWIVKPGELSNRGQGITVIDQIYQLSNIFKKKQKHSNGTSKTYIVQKYLERPLLYKNRKFDIRHYMMISRLHGVMRAYWFAEGYIRTSSYEFNINNIGESIIHLTNDAIQKYCDGYGKYEQGNKLSYNEFQRYMDSTAGEGKFSFSEMIYPKMKSIALDAVKATFLQLDPSNIQHNFEVFGLDFMIDINYNVWLIEVNTNPCLELSSKLLARIIPTMIEQSFRLTLDVIFPPPAHYINSQKYLAPDNPLQRMQFQLIFDQNRDGKQIEELFANARKPDMGEVDEQEETYQNDGKQIELDNEIQ